MRHTKKKNIQITFDPWFCKRVGRSSEKERWVQWRGKRSSFNAKKKNEWRRKRLNSCCVYVKFVIIMRIIQSNSYFFNNRIHRRIEDAWKYIRNRFNKKIRKISFLQSPIILSLQKLKMTIGVCTVAFWGLDRMVQSTLTSFKSHFLILSLAYSLTTTREWAALIIICL